MSFFEIFGPKKQAEADEESRAGGGTLEEASAPARTEVAVDSNGTVLTPGDLEEERRVKSEIQDSWREQK